MVILDKSGINRDVFMVAPSIVSMNLSAGSNQLVLITPLIKGTISISREIWGSLIIHYSVVVS